MTMPTELFLVTHPGTWGMICSVWKGAYILLQVLVICEIIFGQIFKGQKLSFSLFLCADHIVSYYLFARFIAR